MNVVPAKKMEYQKLLKQEEASPARVDWTNADLKAIAVCLNEKSHRNAEDFNTFQKMIEPLKYTHQIDTIGPKEITFYNDKPPRDITEFDVKHAYDFGKLSNTEQDYAKWREHCESPHRPVPENTYKWEFDFERAHFYMQSGKLRASQQKESSIPIGKQESHERPLDNRKEDPGWGEMPPKSEYVLGKEISYEWSK